MLSQKPLHIYIEAKRGDSGLSGSQLDQHILSIIEKGHPGNSAFLIGLTRDRQSDKDDKRWREQALKRGITFVATTYGELVEALDAVCASDEALQEILEDYKTFIGGEKLLPDQHLRLVAMLCGQSWRENIEHGVYFEPASRSPKWTRAHFIGIYHSKQISHLGRLVAAAVCRAEGDALTVEVEEFGLLSEEHKNRIRAVIEAATYFKGFAAESHRYYVVDRFVETSVRKTSAGGMMGHRYLDIAELGGTKGLQENASSKDVAKLLRGATYE